MDYFFSSELFGLFLKSRTLFLTGEIDKLSSRKFQEQILLLEADRTDKPILILIDSEGGDIYSGLAMFNTIKFVRSKIYTIGVGLVASAAALVFIAAHPDRRFSLPYARYLLHQPMTEFDGCVTDIEIYAKELKKIKIDVIEIFSNATGRPSDLVELDMDRDFWLTSHEAKDYGLLFRVVENRSDLPIELI